MTTTMTPMNYSARSPVRPTGFTLVELMVVVVIMGIIAVSVVPAMANVRLMREGAARDDVVRMLGVARGRAMASGRPHGLLVNPADATVTIMEFDAQGDIVEDSDPQTGSARSVDLATTYSGVAIASFVNGNGVGGAGTLWFDYEATPHTRAADGSLIAINTEAAVVTLSSGDQITIYPHTGMVEVME